MSYRNCRSIYVTQVITTSFTVVTNLTFEFNNTYVRYKEMPQAGLESMKGDSPEKENHQHQIWKCSRDVHDLQKKKRDNYCNGTIRS